MRDGAPETQIPTGPLDRAGAGPLVEGKLRLKLEVSYDYLVWPHSHMTKPQDGPASHSPWQLRPLGASLYPEEGQLHWKLPGTLMQRYEQM